MHPPPLLPAPKLKRVKAIAWGDAWSVIAVAGISGIVALWQRHPEIAVACLLVVFCGQAELKGRRLLINERPAGRHWLVGAQLALLVIILAYARHRWVTFDPEIVWGELPAFVRNLIDLRITEAGGDPMNDRFPLLDLTNRLTCILLAVITVVYQGGLALYYLRNARLASAVAQK